MNLENSMFHQGNGSSTNNPTINLESLDSFMFQQGNGASNNSTMNLENFMFLQGNGVSNNGDHPRIPVTPERPYMQRSPYPRLIQKQGYQNNNWMEAMNQSFSPEVPVMQRSNPSSEMRMNQIPFDVGHLTEESVHQQLHLMLAQMQRNQIMQSANSQVPPCNNHSVLSDNQSMQRLNPTPSEMQRNQIMQSANRQVPPWNSHGVLSDNQSMQRLNTKPSEMQGNQIMQSANRQVQPRNNQGVLLDNQSMQRLDSTPSEMQGNQIMQSVNRQVQPRNNHGVLVDNQSMQSLNPTPSEMQGNQIMQSANRQVPPWNSHGVLSDNQSMQRLNTKPSEMQGNQIMQSTNRQVQPRNNQGVLLDNQSMQRLDPTPSEMQGNQIMQSVNRQVQPRNNHGVLVDNQSMQSLNPTPSEMQGNQIMQSANRQVPPRNNHRVLLDNQSMQSLNPRPSEMQGNQIMQSANWQVPSRSNHGVLQDNQSMQNLNPRPSEMQGNQIGNWLQQSYELLTSSSPKQISQTPDTVSTQMQGNQARTSDWLETLGLYTSILHDSPARLVNDDRIGVNGCVPQDTNSHVNNYGRDVAIGNVQWQADMRGAKKAQGTFSDGEQYLGLSSSGMLPAANSSYSHIENNQGQQNCATSNQWQQERVWGMNQTIGTSSLEKNPSDGFHIPNQSLYNHATPSHMEYAADSSTTIRFNNAPVTPGNNNQSGCSQLSATENSYAIESWNPEKDKQDAIRNIREGDRTCSNQPSTVAIASPSNSTSLKEKVPEVRALGGTDSNKTPQQKPPKRKKHRPKVVVEGKPKRPPKTSALKTEVAGDKSTGKRKYVRKKGLETSTPQGNEKSEFEASNSGSATRPCRRELNFDSEEKEQEEPQEINKSVYLHGSHLELNSQGTTPSMGLNCVSVVPDAKKDQQNKDGVGKLQSINSWNLLSAANQRIANEVPRRDLKAQLSTAMDHANLRNIKTQNGMPDQVYKKDEQRQENRVYLETEQMSIQELAWATYNTEMQQLSQSGNHRISDCQEIKDKTGQKRDYINMSEQTSSQYSGGQKKTGQISEISNLGAYKRTRLHESHRVQSSSPSVAAAAENDQWQVCRSMFNCSTETEVSANRNNREIVFTENQFRNAIVVGNNSQKSRALVAEIVNRKKMLREKSQQKTETHVSNLLTGATYNNKMESRPQSVQETIVGNTTMTSRSNAAMKSHTVQVGSSIQEVSAKKILPQNYNEIAYLHSSRKARGKKEEKILSNIIDDLIQRLELLGISDQQGALVPYEGHGTLVPFERFEPIRRRKPRPRVDLDSETITQWNLLMGKAENDAAETGQDKEKWWENERKVFRGRVDTFIARMHLVQGDRRFSRWKGSVVDSVIGVFLTQNVSDHLSSSAFMSLAAQFPLRSATTEITSCRTSLSPWVEEPEVQIIDPDGTITFPQGTLSQPLYKQDSTASSQYFEQSSDNLMTTIRVHLVEDNNNGTPKDVVSSQNSSDSIILQASEDIRNSSDSEVEYQTLFPNSNQSQNQKTDRTDTFQQDPILIRSPSPRPQQIDYLSCMEKNSKLNISKNEGAGPIDLNVLSSEESFDPPSTSTIPLSLISDTRVAESFFPVPTGNQSMSYLNPSEVVATNTQGVFPERMSAESMSVALTSSTTKETGMPKNNTSSMDRYSAASHNVNSQQEYHFGSFQPHTNINQDQSLKSFHFETSTATEAQRPDEAHSKQKTGNLFPTAENLGSAGSKMPKERRKKNDVNKMKEVDWDELRKQVLCEGTNKERGKDKLDSMDYEDLSNAHVDRISDAIRERGMNNMLAERIKAFLNRLVKDHGSIDLEWLRDVPPDKAKDYLLSIRGLGLKSVECIRLLSLHHMAFPVDTNVGRIAVRLGWVPLQPLPESLQLHLLEMYPILESIQKHIWPRLCKLDQRTLYELHYQMITFGKVFCTKSKPNCNVCPMKAECRHFASAFASARLALPGPEEKGMVSSSIQFTPTEDRPIIMDPLLLAFGKSNLGRGLGLMHFSGECEPHVEEPTTPETYTDETTSDIEDLLSDDTNEIPVIEISIEALKANVQNIMQEQNLEISEGDLSKALVALNPATASIPAPKLKNVSRLRTEHHVYELPDWHPVLEGMDRREPDDPSPYLLAIWTPGETADTIQPYENSCTLRGSGRLCDDKTCFHCNSVREADSQIIRGTILIPCRTAMRGSFPLNGTYFQVNEVFADHESSMNPIAVPRDLLWNLRRRTVYFGTSVTTIFRGMPIEEIQYCFWRGFVCVRGFDRMCRAPRPLMARLHFPASKLAKNKKEGK